MKISFPYMGCVTGYKKMFQMLGHDVIMPPRPTQRTIDLGVLHSPEFICYPFKMMMGTYVEVCEMGAEMIISSGGSGPCRAGMYGELHEKILRGLGYDVPVVIFDSIFENFGKFFKKLLQIKNKTPLYKVPKIFVLVAKLINQMDGFEKEVKRLRAYETRRGDFDRCFNKIAQIYDGCNTLRQLKKVKAQARALLDAVPVNVPDERKKVRIGVVGEIYVAMESFTNMDIERRINSMGAEAYNVHYISDWLRHTMVPRAISTDHSWKMWEKAEKYKTCNCGGHDMENTGCIMDFAERGFDGVVHLMPFGCLPELVTRSIIPQMSEDLDMPILSISIDEQQGEANLQTRIEAFVELCKSKKRSQTAMPVQNKETDKAIQAEEKYVAV